MVAKYEPGLNSTALFSWEAQFVLRLDYRLANREIVVPLPMTQTFTYIKHTSAFSALRLW